MEREELGAWLRLAWAPGVGPAAARRLLAAFGSPAAVLEAGDQALGQLLAPAQLQHLRQVPEGFEAQLDTTCRWLDTAPPAGRRRVLALGDPAYPASLLQIEDPPLLLYLAGDASTELPESVAIVGSRNPTPQGVTHARAFGQALAQAGWTVVSGLALGIDAAAHDGALEGAAAGQLATVAVVGTGLDQVYPRRNLELARRIAERGWLMSEYPLGTPPLPQNFPRRNRLIAGLSRGTLVVEAALESGSLITARLAAEQGKEVFAVPGSIQSPQSRGCHALLREGAKLVETAQDVLEELGALRGAARTPAPSAPPADDPAGLLHALGFDPVGVDALVARTGIPPSQLQGQLLELELAGEVARLPGGLYQRIGSA